MSRRNPKVLGVWGDRGARVVASESYWRQPLRWDREAAAAGERRRVFCASLADVFEDRPELTLPRCRLLSLIHKTPNLDWLLLTKRPEGVMDRLHECSTQEDKDHGDDGRLGINDGACLAYQWKHDSPMPNVWLGTSVEDQPRAAERIPHLLCVPAAVRFLSCEPLLGPVDLNRIRWQDWWSCSESKLLHWVVIGGESGGSARPFDLAWARSLVRQCRDAGVAVFVKQLGANPQYETVVTAAGGERPTGYRLGLELADPKGGDPQEWPEDLRVRQFPEGHRA